MFKRFDRLVPIFNFKQDTLSLYGDIMAYAFFNNKITNNPKETYPKEKWATKDFNIKSKGDIDKKITNN